MKGTIFASLFLVFFILTNGEASGEVSVKGIRYWSSEQYTRVVVDLSDHIEFVQNRLSKPDRLYFDLKNSSLSDEVEHSVIIGDGILRDIRAGQFDEHTVRIVLDLLSIKNFNVFTLKSPDRLVIDIFGRRDTDSGPEKKIIEESDRKMTDKSGKKITDRPGKKVTEEPRKKKAEAPGKKITERPVRIRRVIIDPGHGGKDPGAIGPRGLKEKDITLAIAKKVGKILKKNNDIEVIFTRKSDVYIPLEKRTYIANSKNADLFISIHVNASRKRKVKGIETYILNWTTDRESMRVAARENAISFKKMQQSQSELQLILKDLARDNKKDESMKLAHNVQLSLIKSLRKDYRDVADLGVKGALFYVLVGADMPSILIEASFISNRVEERRLSKKKYREKIAEAIVNGINEYMEPDKFVKRVSGQS